MFIKPVRVLGSMPKRILVPVDGSPQSHRALEYAVAEHPDASFIVLHVVNPSQMAYATDPSGMDYWEDWYESAQDRAAEILEEAEGVVEAAAASVASAIEVGSPARVIVDYAEEKDADLIVMGSHGRSGVSRILLGSVAETVVRRAPCPVTVVR